MDGRSMGGRAIRSGVGWQASTKFWPHQRPDTFIDRAPPAACADVELAALNLEHHLHADPEARMRKEHLRPSRGRMRWQHDLT